MYHLIIKELGVERCLAVSEEDEFTNGMYIDCAQDHGCIPANPPLREINIICEGNKAIKRKAKIYSD